MPPQIPRAKPPGGAAPLPGARVSPQAPLEAFGGGAAAQPIDLSDAASVADRIWTQARERADTTITLDADNKAWEVERELFHDPVNGAFTKRGKDALPAVDQAMEDYKKRLDEIASGLTTERQRAMFYQSAQSRRIALDGQAQRYVAGELRTYTDGQTQAALDNRTDQAAVEFSDQARVQELITEKRNIIVNYARQHGISTEEVERQLTLETSKTHSVVLIRMLSQGADVTAKGYFDKYQQEMTATDRTEIERQLGRVSTDNSGMRAAGAVWNELGPKSPQDPIKMSDMENLLRERFPDQPEVVKAGIQDLRTRAEAFNAQQRETSASNKAVVLGAFNNGMRRAEAIRMPQYLALSGTEQEQLNSYMQDRGRTMSERAREDVTRRGFQTYWQYSDPSTLNRMSENEVLALEPQLGQELTGELMEQKRAMAKGEVREASIDRDQFNHLLRQAGYDPTDKDSQAEIGALLYHLENAIETEQGSKNRKLTRTEKTELMTKMVNDRVLINRFMWFDPAKPLVAVQRDQIGRAYVPIADLQKNEPSFVQEAINWMRSEGRFLPSVTDQQALNTGFARLIERAYVVRRTGGTDEEIQAILRGEP